MKAVREGPSVTREKALAPEAAERSRAAYSFMVLYVERARAKLWRSGEGRMHFVYFVSPFTTYVRVIFSLSICPIRKRVHSSLLERKRKLSPYFGTFFSME